MKYIKKFENNKDPQIGDYVIVHEHENDPKNKYKKEKLNNFLDNNIGRYIRENSHIIYTYEIQYDNIEDYISYFNVETKSRLFSREEIVNFSPNKEDLEHYLTAKNYNI